MKTIAIIFIIVGICFFSLGYVLQWIDENFSKKIKKSVDNSGSLM